MHPIDGEEAPPCPPPCRRRSCPARASNIGHMRRFPPPSFKKARKACNLSTAWGRAAVRDTQYMPDGDERGLLHLSRCVVQSGRSLRHVDYCRQRGSMAVWPGWCPRLRPSRCCWSFRHGAGVVNEVETEPQKHRTTEPEPQTAPQHPPRVKCKCPSRRPTRIGLPSHDSHWPVCWSVAAAVPSILIFSVVSLAVRVLASSRLESEPGVLGWIGTEDGGWRMDVQNKCPRMGGGKVRGRRGGAVPRAVVQPLQVLGLHPGSLPVSGAGRYRTWRAPVRKGATDRALSGSPFFFASTTALTWFRPPSYS